MHYDSIVLEEQETYRVRSTPLDIMIDLCNQNFANLAGRIEGAIRQLNYKYKVPIIVSECHMLYAFPTRAIRNHACAWIFLHGIRSFHQEGKQSVIIFHNDQSVTLDISYHILNEQIRKTMELKEIYERCKLEAEQMR